MYSTRGEIEIEGGGQIRCRPAVKKLHPYVGDAASVRIVRNPFAIRRDTRREFLRGRISQPNRARDPRRMRRRENEPARKNAHQNATDRRQDCQPQYAGCGRVASSGDAWRGGLVQVVPHIGNVPQAQLRILLQAALQEVHDIRRRCRWQRGPGRRPPTGACGRCSRSPGRSTCSRRCPARAR